MDSLLTRGLVSTDERSDDACMVMVIVMVMMVMLMVMMMAKVWSLFPSHIHTGLIEKVAFGSGACTLSLHDWSMRSATVHLLADKKINSDDNGDGGDDSDADAYGVDDDEINKSTLRVSWCSSSTMRWTGDSPLSFDPTEAPPHRFLDKAESVSLLSAVCCSTGASLATTACSWWQRVAVACS
jgi:hypothetical protein